MAAAPARLDVLRRMRVTAVAAAKFHSVALMEDGRLFSWGFGRGGRTGLLRAKLSRWRAIVLMQPSRGSLGYGTVCCTREHLLQ